jgi:hypothetical protein
MTDINTGVIRTRWPLTAWHQDQTADVHYLCDEVDKLTEMLTAATDTAIQRGKAIDEIREAYHLEQWWKLDEILDGADGG